MSKSALLSSKPQWAPGIESASSPEGRGSTSNQRCQLVDKQKIICCCSPMCDLCLLTCGHSKLCIDGQLADNPGETGIALLSPTRQHSEVFGEVSVGNTTIAHTY
eukprot:Gb_13215 [translate_table: standard]